MFYVFTFMLLFTQLMKSVFIMYRAVFSFINIDDWLTDWFLSFIQVSMDKNLTCGGIEIAVVNFRSDSFKGHGKSEHTETQSGKF